MGKLMSFRQYHADQAGQPTRQEKVLAIAELALPLKLRRVCTPLWEQIASKKHLSA